MRCVLLFALLCTICANSARAQTTPLETLNKGAAPPTAWMEFADKELSAQEPGSDAYMSAMLVRCLAVYHQDRGLCSRFCEDAERVAEAAGRSNVVAAARMLRAETLADRGKEFRKEYNSACSLFDGQTAKPDTATLFYLSRGSVELLSGMPREVEPQIASIRAAQECKNTTLQVLGTISQLSQAKQTETVDGQALDSLLQKAQSLPFPDLSGTVRYLQISNSAEPPEKILQQLLNLLDELDGKNVSRGLKAGLLLAITQRQLALGQNHDVCQHVNRLCQNGRDLQSNTVLVAALAAKLDNEICLEQPEQSEAVAKELVAILPDVKNPAVQTAAYKSLLAAAVEDNDKQQAFELSQSLASTMAHQARDALIRQSIRTELERLRETTVQAQAENDSLAADREAALNKIQMYQWTSLIIVSTLAALLAFSLFRVRRANEKLSEQIASNQRGQKVQEELTDRVAQADRMESLGALAGGIAHDFNNLLVGVVCNAEVLQMYHDQTPQSEKCLNGILKAAETASDLSRKMLAYAGRQPSEKRAADLNKLIRPIVSLAQSGLIDSNIEFIASDKPAIANVDETQIEQVVLNLLNNASEAMGDRDGSNITVSIGAETISETNSDPFLIGAAHPPGNYVYIEVSDTGRGVSASDIRRIFEPFQSSNPQRGRGMGLSVVYGHVNRHDGLIRVRSGIGEGTSFRVLLPKSDSLPEVIRVVPGTFDLPESGYILFVDDEHIIRDVATRFIRQVDWQVTTCSSGEEAIEFFHKTSQLPDCICLDVVMPGIDGTEVVQQLAQMGIDIPVIMMSGYSNTNQEEFLKDPLVLEFLAKPFNTEQLLAAVSRAISSRPRQPISLLPR